MATPLAHCPCIGHINLLLPKVESTHRMRLVLLQRRCWLFSAHGQGSARRADQGMIDIMETKHARVLSAMPGWSFPLHDSTVCSRVQRFVCCHPWITCTVCPWVLARELALRIERDKHLHVYRRVDVSSGHAGPPS